MDRFFATYKSVLRDILSRKWVLPLHAFAGAAITLFLSWLCQGWIWQMVLPGLFILNTFWIFAAWETTMRLWKGVLS